MREPAFTLTAGPTMASPRVLAALGSPSRTTTTSVLERFKSLERKLADLYRTRGDVVLMQGEAVLGLEAAARALVRPGTTAINLVSGVYGKWFGLWLRDFEPSSWRSKCPTTSPSTPVSSNARFASIPVRPSLRSCTRRRPPER